MSQGIGWFHPTDESDQWDGFNEPGIEHFRGDPIFHLAREINQNALDAAEDGLVRVEFRSGSVPVSSLPDLEEFRTTIQCCLEASIDESERARNFFEVASKMLSKRHMPVLEICDFNTTGMKGPAVNGTPFYAFMKATGQSKKDNLNASGSYGIGKLAPYAVSDLRTVFVSTVYCRDDGECSQLTQGKSILMSHERNGQRRRGVGFWGVREKCRPIEGILSENAWLQRAEVVKPTEKGTKIVILGFEPASDWVKLLALSVAENFFGAIAGDKLTVRINDEVALSSHNIRDFFADAGILRTIQNEEDERERFFNCRAYLKALDDTPEVQVEETEHRELGLCRVRILVDEGLPKRVCVLRNGMLITDGLSRLKSFPDFKEFVAVVECLSTKGNQLLRDMEPPRHDYFEPDRLPTVDRRKIGKRALRELATWVREMIKRHAKEPTSSRTSLSELKDFFGDELSQADGYNGEETNPSGHVTITAKPVPRKSLYQTVATGKIQDAGDNVEGEGDAGVGGNGEGSDGSGRGQDGGTDTDGDGGDAGGGGTPTGGIAVVGGRGNKQVVRLDDVRALTTGPDERKVSFTPAHTGRIRLRLMRAGADTDHSMEALGSSDGDVDGGCVVLNVTAGSRTTVSVKIGKTFNGSMKVVAYEV